MKKLTKQSLIAAIALGVSGAALADREHQGCTPDLLDGLYVFHATGYNIVAGVAQPKAIVEYISFEGDGTMSGPAATRSINGVIARSPPGGTGTYTLANLVPRDEGCSGTLTFTGGPSFDLFVPAKGDVLWMIQTDPNSVLQGTVTKVSH